MLGAAESDLGLNDVRTPTLSPAKHVALSKQRQFLQEQQQRRNRRRWWGPWCCGCADMYECEVAPRAKAVAESGPFQTLIIAAIFLAGVNVGLSTYRQMDGNIYIGYLDSGVLLLFIVEIAIKIVACGLKPWRYWVGDEWGWNNFDFWIVVMSLPGVLPANVNVAIFRLLRLMRVTKLVGKVRELNIIVTGLVSGLGSVSYISMLWLLVLFLYGVVGVTLFRANDPGHFGNLLISMLTLFRCTTLEDWSDVMYINYYGCDVYTGGLYSEADELTKIHAGGWGIFYSFDCVKPSATSAQKIGSVLFFVSFIFITSFTILSLFVGAVSMGMMRAMQESDSAKFDDGDAPPVDALSALQAAQAHDAAVEKHLHTKAKAKRQSAKQEKAKLKEAKRTSSELLGLSNPHQYETNEEQKDEKKEASDEKKTKEKEKEADVKTDEKEEEEEEEGEAEKDSSHLFQTSRMQGRMRSLSEKARKATALKKELLKAERATRAAQAQRLLTVVWAIEKFVATAAAAAEQAKEEEAERQWAAQQLLVAPDLLLLGAASLVSGTLKTLKQAVVLQEPFAPSSPASPSSPSSPPPPSLASSSSSSSGRFRSISSGLSSTSGGGGCGGGGALMGAEVLPGFDLPQALIDSLAQSSALAVDKRGAIVRTTSSSSSSSSSGFLGAESSVDAGGAGAGAAGSAEDNPQRPHSLRKQPSSSFRPGALRTGTHESVKEQKRHAKTMEKLFQAVAAANADPTSPFVDTAATNEGEGEGAAGGAGEVGSRKKRSGSSKKLSKKLSVREDTLSSSSRVLSKRLSSLFTPDEDDSDDDATATGGGDGNADALEEPLLLSEGGCCCCRCCLRCCYEPLALFCAELEAQPFFEGFVTVTIITAGALVGLQTAYKWPVLWYLDVTTSWIFIWEAAVKIVAQGQKPLRYFDDAWNRFDFTIVMTGLIPDVLGMLGVSLEGLEGLAVLRLLRLLRALKLLNAVPQLQIIVLALIEGVSSMGYISIIILLVLYMFSIAAMIFFSENDPWHFGSLHMSMLTLFQCATLDDWTDVMYVNMYGCDQYGYPWSSGRSSSGKAGYGPLGGACLDPQPWGWLAALFFIVFEVLGSLVLLTLFVGVVGISMDQAKRSLTSQKEAAAKLAAVIAATGVSSLHLDSYRMLFATLDPNKNDSLSREEIGPFLGSINPLFSAADIENVFTLVDNDGSGRIELAEFVQLMVFFKDAAEQGAITVHRSSLLEEPPPAEDTVSPRSASFDDDPSSPSSPGSLLLESPSAGSSSSSAAQEKQQGSRSGGSGCGTGGSLSPPSRPAPSAPSAPSGGCGTLEAVENNKDHGENGGDKNGEEEEEEEEEAAVVSAEVAVIFDALRAGDLSVSEATGVVEDAVEDGDYSPSHAARIWREVCLKLDSLREQQAEERRVARAEAGGGGGGGGAVGAASTPQNKGNNDGEEGGKEGAIDGDDDDDDDDDEGMFPSSSSAPQTTEEAAEAAAAPLFLVIDGVSSFHSAPTSNSMLRAQSPWVEERREEQAFAESALEKIKTSAKKKRKKTEKQEEEEEEETIESHGVALFSSPSPSPSSSHAVATSAAGKRVEMRKRQHEQQQQEVKAGGDVGDHDVREEGEEEEKEGVGVEHDYHEGEDVVGYLVSPSFRMHGHKKMGKQRVDKNTKKEQKEEWRQPSQLHRRRPSTAYERFAALQFRFAALLAEEEMLLKQTSILRENLAGIQADEKLHAQAKEQRVALLKERSARTISAFLANQAGRVVSEKFEKWCAVVGEQKREAFEETHRKVRREQAAAHAKAVLATLQEKVQASNAAAAAAAAALTEKVGRKSLRASQLQLQKQGTVAEAEAAARVAAAEADAEAAAAAAAAREAANEAAVAHASAEGEERGWSNAHSKLEEAASKVKAAELRAAAAEKKAQDAAAAMETSVEVERRALEEIKDAFEARSREADRVELQASEERKAREEVEAMLVEAQEAQRSAEAQVLQGQQALVRQQEEWGKRLEQQQEVFEAAQRLQDEEREKHEEEAAEKAVETMETDAVEVEGRLRALERKEVEFERAERAQEERQRELNKKLQAERSNAKLFAQTAMAQTTAVSLAEEEERVMALKRPQAYQRIKSRMNQASPSSSSEDLRDGNSKPPRPKKVIRTAPPPPKLGTFREKLRMRNERKVQATASSVRMAIRANSNATDDSNLHNGGGGGEGLGNSNSGGAVPAGYSGVAQHVNPFVSRGKIPRD